MKLKALSTSSAPTAITMNDYIALHRGHSYSHNCGRGALMKIGSINYGHYGIYISRLLQQLWQLIHTDFTIEDAYLGQH
jgi:hypothetical protein